MIYDYIKNNYFSDRVLNYDIKNILMMMIIVKSHLNI